MSLGYLKRASLIPEARNSNVGFRCARSVQTRINLSPNRLCRRVTDGHDETSILLLRLPMKFYTIGYGGRLPEELAGLLVARGVRSVADVRIRPDRASMGAFVKARTPDKGIEKLLSERGIAYRSFLELGNLFREVDDWRGPYRELFDRGGRARQPAGRPAGIVLSALCRETRIRMSPAGHRRFPGRQQRLDGRAYRVKDTRGASLFSAPAANEWGRIRENRGSATGCRPRS